ncbi:DUF2793 domain-containing protein [Oricola sp.]|uniref:DUF2793 domain-containing protein n=1 Tax=Oricola sp. TaxID=1979950 RepID=UPI0025E3A109|nr:DUF2793 domain-containing protein [Oricola sp.]MCI5073597.1 DUF2793 domain-containing protein [Oricola sp.]
MERSSNLDMPFILPSQAQKHVTHNEALLRIDALVQLAVVGSDSGVPPAEPAEGERHIVGAAATGDWAGHETEIAAFQDGAWTFHVPQSGWCAWSISDAALLVWTGTEWSNLVAGLVNPVALLGVNTVADETNRLAVKADAVLHSHDDVTPGSGSAQHVINKNAEADTASIVFQTGWSGRAEFGLAGDDKLHAKVSTDGASWREAMVIDPANGFAGFGTASPIAGVSVERTTGLLAAFVSDNASIANLGGAGMVGYIKETPTLADARLGYLLFGSRGGGGVGLHPCGIQGLADAAWIADTSYPAYVNVLTTQSGSTGRVARWRWEAGGHYRPETDNSYTIGDASHRVSAVWAANGTIQTSDARDKTVTGGLDFAGAMVDAVDPKLFTWIVGGNVVVPSAEETQEVEGGEVVPQTEVVAQPGTRVHAGFIAQDLKAAMDAAGVDFGAWGLEDKGDPDSRQWTRPDQLIAVLWAALKKTRAEVAALQEYLDSE